MSSSRATVVIPGPTPTQSGSPVDSSVKTPLRLVMMGTGAFAMPTFRALLETRHRVVGLVTQPDHVGRGHHRHSNPLKELALERSIPVLQPERINRPESAEQFRALQPDLCIVAAYGQILSPAVIDAARRAINVHASLLPKYRGAAPIQWAIRNGEAETGVTLFQIEPALDAGPILAMNATPIGPRETAGELEERLAAMGAELVLETVDRILAGTIEPRVQEASQASRAPRLKKQDGRIDWRRTAAEIDCHVRAMQPWPMADTLLVSEPESGRRLRVIVLEVAPAETAGQTPGEPGVVLTAERGRLVVGTGGGAVEIVRLCPEGKRPMSAADFLRGRRVEPGERFE